MRDVPYLTIEKNARLVYVLVVEQSETKRSEYPLAKNGLLKAGRDLYEAGVTQWQHSSSLDHADEYGCLIDIHEVIAKGFEEARSEATSHELTCEVKLFRFADCKDFKSLLSPKELDYFETLRTRVLQSS